mmetsp:Transcript_10040/g.12729  ORF Transcript_10040/g.12729 Transcript_10040/m.12729 type:complete len:504 (-) Transcript_10040:60-1571(-)
MKDDEIKTFLLASMKEEIMKDDEIKTSFLSSLKDSLFHDDQMSSLLHAHVNAINSKKEDDNQSEKRKKHHRHRSDEFIASVIHSKGVYMFPQAEQPSISGNTSQTTRLDRMRALEDDTYTLMMMSTSYGFSWCFLFGIFLVQICLLSVILIELLYSRGSERLHIFNAPMANQLFVTIGQFFALIFALFSQRDLLEGFTIFIALFDQRNIAEMNKTDEGGKVRESDRVFFWEKIFLTYFFKLLGSTITLLVAQILIVQSSDLIDLLKDFTALFIIASLDNLVYYCIGDGYFGHLFDKEIQRKENIIITAKTRFTNILCFKLPCQSVLFVAIVVIMLTIWGEIVVRQRLGIFFYDNFPNCKAISNLDNSLKYEFWGDGVCDPALYSNECGMDGKDCNEYCMTTWINPSLTLWSEVQNQLSKERTDSCLLDKDVINLDENNLIIDVNGFVPLKGFDYDDLYGEFSKCFTQETIFDNGDDSSLGLFCYLGDYTEDLNGRENPSNSER